MGNILSIDIGTTSVKALIMGEYGKVLAESSVPHQLVSLHPGWAEEDPLQWTQGVAEALKALKNDVPEAFEHLSLAGVCGMVPAIVMLDERNVPVRNAILQNDARCSEQIRRLKDEIDQDWLFERTGGLTNQQHVLPRILWVKENEPEKWSMVRRIMGSYEYICSMITGYFYTEKNWAVESGLWDIHENCWLSGMLEKYGISESMLAEVHEPSEIVGVAADGIEESIGVPGRTPFIAGSADHVAATLACGIVEPGDLLIKFGGAGDILYCTGSPVTDKRLFFDVHDVPRKYLLNGCMAASGSLLKWYVAEILGNGVSFKELDEEAGRIKAGSDGLLVLPYFLGEKTPVLDPEARGVFFGLTLAHTRAHMYRAILESVIFGFRHHLDVLKEKGIEPKRIYAADGGAKSPLWCHIAADILGRPVYAFQDGKGSAYGTALLAGMVAGMFGDWSDIRNMLPEPVVYEPNPKNTIIYEKQYSVYLELYRKTSGLMHELGSISNK